MSWRDVKHPGCGEPECFACKMANVLNPHIIWINSLPTEQSVGEMHKILEVFQLLMEQLYKRPVIIEFGPSQEEYEEGKRAFLEYLSKMEGKPDVVN